jgi:hypothetical protein
MYGLQLIIDRGKKVVFLTPPNPREFTESFAEKATEMLCAFYLHMPNNQRYYSNVLFRMQGELRYLCRQISLGLCSTECFTRRGMGLFAGGTIASCTGSGSLRSTGRKMYKN